MKKSPTTEEKLREDVQKIIQNDIASEVIYQDTFAEKVLLRCLLKIENSFVDFISQTTTQTREETIEEIEKMKKEEEITNSDLIFNLSLQVIITNLKEK